MSFIKQLAQIVWNIFVFILKAISRLIIWWADKVQNSSSTKGAISWLGVGFVTAFCFLCSALLVIVPTDADSDDRNTKANTSITIAEATDAITTYNTPTSTPLNTSTHIPLPIDSAPSIPTNTQIPNTSTPKPTILPTSTPKPTNTLTFTPTPSITPTPPYPIGDFAEVVKVLDGDTIDVSIDGVVYPVRYIGMDTPERGETYFTESTQANADLVEGQTVVLVKDVSETDRYNRLLRYVYRLDGTFVNAELVRLGFAQPATYPPDVAYQAEFEELFQKARADLVGLWGLPTNTPVPLPTWTSVPLSTPVPQPTSPPVVPTTAPQPTTAPPPPPEQNCDPSYPTVCIPSPPPDLDCGDIPHRRFQVLQPDPHGFDRDKDGIGCESG